MATGTLTNKVTETLTMAMGTLTSKVMETLTMATGTLATETLATETLATGTLATKVTERTPLEAPLLTEHKNVSLFTRDMILVSL